MSERVWFCVSLSTIRVGHFGEESCMSHSVLVLTPTLTTAGQKYTKKTTNDKISLSAG